MVFRGHLLRYCAPISGLAVHTGGWKRAVLMSRPTKELPHTSLQKVCISSTSTPGWSNVAGTRLFGTGGS